MGTASRDWSRALDHRGNTRVRRRESSHICSGHRRRRAVTSSAAVLAWRRCCLSVPSSSKCRKHLVSRSSSKSGPTNSSSQPAGATLRGTAGRSIDRAREQMIGARDMGAQVIAICDSQDAATMALADVVFPIEGQLAEEFSPLTYLIPGELPASGLCPAGGRPALSFMSSFISPRQHEVNMRHIKHSQQRLT